MQLTKGKNNNNNKNRSKTLKRNKFNNNNNINNQKGGSGTKEDYVFISNKISTQPNTDTNYKEIGVIHITESGAVNALKDFATGIVNLFGSKGFDNSVYDKARNLALKKIMKHMDINQKISNLRMDVENNHNSTLFFIHLYGTLLEKK